MSLKLDNIDVQILELLQDNSRLMYKDIAKKIGISLPTVKNRIKRLSDLGVIKKFTVIIDPEKIFGKVRSLIYIQTEPSSLEELVKLLSNMKEVREIFITAGSYSLVLKVEVRSLNELVELIYKRLSEIKGINSYSHLIITKVIKEEYGASVEVNDTLFFKCDFCNSPILGKPWIEFIKGGKYYFHSKDCAEAYKERMSKL